MHELHTQSLAVVDHLGLREKEREGEGERAFVYVCVRVCKKQRAVDSRREKTYGTRAHLQSPVLRES